MSKDQEKLRIIPIGGLGEVGKNMMVYEYNGQILIVDAGLMFPDNDMLGVDYIIPDFKYLRDHADRFWES
jgi:ribonuclease J